MCACLCMYKVFLFLKLITFKTAINFLPLNTCNSKINIIYVNLFTHALELMQELIKTHGGTIETFLEMPETIFLDCQCFLLCFFFFLLAKIFWDICIILAGEKKKKEKKAVIIFSRKIPNSFARISGQYLSNKYLQKVLLKHLHIWAVPKKILVLF